MALKGFFYSLLISVRNKSDTYLKLFKYWVEVILYP